MKGERFYQQAQEAYNELLEAHKVTYSDETDYLDFSQMIKWYNVYIDLIRKSAYVGYPLAQYELGLHYEIRYFFGLNPHYDPVKSEYWYIKACDANVGDACNNLALMYYENGKEEEVKELFLKRIRLKSKLAKSNFKLFYGRNNK
ncbi:tetratricopeptide repeat protein [Myroides marinus]|uniref:tetratricopeptide repeat protein n=1 Tax=Myroides marinus TaxID=703342 RepID=UPI0025778FA9|nr:hypothetical protein [Myroides marinus]MDM1380721.1 sel1 repeat family protein [Myroides marinus]MDM1387965.1 sel1 repeat family protein [Myroides marinus]MDM1395205.1 sel1 repeat family protein [Myroides marinus]